ncbi:hypothetical protein [Roseisolibacter agri]|uniref:Uncharacterized protein n=1 Tax=Roseisolibacter agri TaxID=2014610 RepID=A0AA37QDU4_9BACT|nr:hypothetical protein [Roseisolibacter agri]GLC27066.1 hypothetical protein rosag_35790 [Roseisolibacter agri]
MDAESQVLHAMRRLEVAMTATAGYAPPDSRLIENAAEAVTRELVALGQGPDAVRRLAAWVARCPLALERADLTERMRRAVERTLETCEIERRTPTDSHRAVTPPSAMPAVDAGPTAGTTGEHRLPLFRTDEHMVAMTAALAASLAGPLGVDRARE